MGFEQLLSSLEEKGRAQEREVVNAAQAEARKVKNQAEQEAQKLKEQAVEKGRQEGQEQKAEMYAAARLQAKRIVAEARETAVNDALLQLESELKAFTGTSEYNSLLLELAQSGVKAIGKNAVVKARKEDEKTLQKTGFSVQPFKCMGGVLVETPDSKVKVDNTLESLIQRFTPQLKQKAYEELFPKSQVAKQPLQNQQAKPAVKSAQSKKKVKKRRK